MADARGYLLGDPQTPDPPWPRRPHKVSTHIRLGHQYSAPEWNAHPVATALTNTDQVLALCLSSVTLRRPTKERSLPSWSLHSGGEGRKETSEFQVVTRNSVRQCGKAFTQGPLQSVLCRHHTGVMVLDGESRGFT